MRPSPKPAERLATGFAKSASTSIKRQSLENLSDQADDSNYDKERLLFPKVLKECADVLDYWMRDLCIRGKKLFAFMRETTRVGHDRIYEMREPFEPQQWANVFWVTSCCSVNQRQETLSRSPHPRAHLPVISASGGNPSSASKLGAVKGAKSTPTWQRNNWWTTRTM